MSPIASNVKRALFACTSYILSACGWRHSRFSLRRVHMIIGITSEETLCVVDDSRTLFHYNFSLKPVEMQIKTSRFLIAARFLIFPDVVQ